MIRISIFLFCLLVRPAFSEALVCQGSLVSVAASDPAHAERVCRSVATAQTLFSDCGLPEIPPIVLRVLEPAEGLSPHCLAEFDCVAMEAQISNPATLAARETPWPVFGRIDPGSLFDSLVVHELAHAAMSQPAGGRRISAAGQEYVAYVMQLASLPKSDREQVLAHTPVAPPETLDELNEMILALAPNIFLAKAWSHFRDPANGCDFIGDILSQRRVLGVLVE